MTSIWCMVSKISSMMDAIVIFLFGLFFVPLPPPLPHFLLITPKMKISNKWKKKHFTQAYQKSWPYAILFLRYGAWQMQLLFFILGYLLPYYPLTAQKIKIFKKWKKHMEISSFYTYVYQKLWLDDVQFLGNGAQRTDRRTDRKSDT